jgi:DAACS family dicarboxylate/amino acid:cation (Na+ or H+) symporter
MNKKTDDAMSDAPSAPVRGRRWPLSIRVLIAVAAGTALGLWGGQAPYLGSFGNDQLGQLGMLVIRLLKALAIPLILFAIMDAFLRAPITARAGGRLVAICLGNVSVAFAIGLTLMNVLEPGASWHGRIEQLTSQVAAGPVAEKSKAAAEASLDPLRNLAGYVPQSLLQPLIDNNVIAVVLIALLFGVALGRLKRREGETDVPDIRPLENLIGAGYYLLVHVLGWIVEIIPFAVFGLIAQVVGRAGFAIFADLAPFLGVIVLGLCLHGFVYYPLAAWVIGGKAPRIYLREGSDAVLTAVSTNSSLATIPVTLRCLKSMQVPEHSARLAVCAGTNLNNDGITLYEAMAALFLAEALGYHFGLGQQIVIMLSALMAGAGVAGIPEAGLIVLPLVLSAVGLPEAVVAAAIPLVAPVDWIIARLRSVVNVLSDMLVAILLDAWESRTRR